MAQLLYKGTSLNSVPNDGKYISYDNAKSGLDSTTVQAAIDELTENKPRTFYCTCATAGATAAKVVSCSDSDFAVKTGTVIVVSFTNTNSASSVTLNVNSTGAKSIYVDNVVYADSESYYCGFQSRQIVYMYNGTGWAYIGKSWDIDTKYDAITTSYIDGLF